MILLIACASWMTFACLFERLCRKLAALSAEGRRYCARQMRSSIDAGTTEGWKSLSRLMLRLHCGKMIVRGSDTLNAEGPKLIVANHCHYLDPAVFLLSIKQPVWFMASHLVFKFGRNIVGAFIGRAGAFPVDTNRGNGAPAARDAIRLLCEKQSVVMFPEGDAFFDSQTGSFSSGAIQIVRLVRKVCELEVPIVPVFLEYQGHPGGWIRRFPFPLQCLIVLFSFPLWRRPLKVTVGSPLLESEFSEDRDLAAEQLRLRVIALKNAGSTDQDARA